MITEEDFKKLKAGSVLKLTNYTNVNATVISKVGEFSNFRIYVKIGCCRRDFINNERINEWHVLSF